MLNRERGIVSRHPVARVAPVVLLAVALGLGGCGIPTGDASFREIANEDIPFGLEATTTTTSTTTTTLPAAPETTELTTTTIALEPVEIYFLSRGRLQPMPLVLTSGFAPDQVVDRLEAGPPPGVGLTTLIERGLVQSTDIAEGVVTVDLDPAVFARIATNDQAEAIGQIVLSLMRNLRGVGFVRFTLGGEPTQVKKGDSLLSEPDEPVTQDDYAVLLASTPPTTTTSTTTTVPPVTEPAPAAVDTTPAAEPGQ